VIDAYACVRRGDRQWVVRASDALGDGLMDQRVGPYRIEVEDPLNRVRVVCEDDGDGLGFDLVFHASSPPIDEPQHLVRTGPRLIIEGCRFAQVGAWEGVVRVDGEAIDVTPDRWVATRDRSWGIRPVGEAEPAGRPADGGDFGFWWVWAPLRFDDFALMVIAQEASDGTRVLSHAVRVWPEASGRPPEQLGWPEFEIEYRSGTRYPERAMLHLTDRNRKPIAVEIEPRGAMALTVGCGYNGDPDWNHGQWKGPGWVERAMYDYTDGAVRDRLPFSVIDHAAKATIDGAEGWGIFEHASIGRHTPSGMADFGAVAP
jgi:hypothetical protein